MKKYITLAVMLSLFSGEKFTAQKLAEKYETSVKTIYRAIDTLLEAGMPIMSKQGKNGGYELIKQSGINTSFFTKEELSSFISFINSTQQNILGENIASIQDRLNTLPDKTLAFELCKTSASLVIDTNTWGSKDKNNANSNIIKKAISSSNKLLISYLDKNGRFSKRAIEPYTLVYKTGVWYVYGFCEQRKAFRLFKLARIKSIVNLNEKFEKQNINTLSKPWNKEFEANLEKIEIELLCPKSIIADLYEWLGEDITISKFSNEKCNQYSNVNNDYNLINGVANFSIGLVHRLMQFGSLIKVLKPTKLQEAIKNECYSIYNSYAI